VAVAAVVVVMLGTEFTVMVSDFVAVTLSASVTMTVKVCVVAVEPTVPLMTPDAGFSVSPVGSVPDEIDHVSGVVPPEMTSVCA
jgi:hypothetical protein